MFPTVSKMKLCKVHKDDLKCGYVSFFAFLLAESKEFSHEDTFITICHPLSFASVLS